MSKKIVVLIAIIAALVLLFGGQRLWNGSGSGEHMGIYTEATVDSINISWKEQENVQFYEVYRVEIPEDNGNIPTFDEYEKVATVLGDEKSYTDKDVETGHTYGYVVSGFYRSFGHTKQVCTSYMDDDLTYETAGPAKPALLNNGEGENHENTKDTLYLYLETYSGMEPTGVELYRKSSKDKDFVQIDCTFEDGHEIMDDSVTPMETYTYKARTYVEENGKKEFSDFSDEVTISAVNLIADYKVKVAESDKDTFTIEVTSGQYNGVTEFNDSMPALYSVQKNKKSSEDRFAATLIGYSKSFSAGKTEWLAVPKKGVKVKAGESMYLRYKLSVLEDEYEEADPNVDVYFGGSDAYESVLHMDGDVGGGVEYCGSGAGFTVMALDLVEGTGKAYCDWD